MKEDKIYVEHIINCIDKIQNYAKGGKESFYQDELIYDGCLRQLQIMSESTTRLSDEFKISLNIIPWDEIRGFRNILVHEYMGDIDYNTVWMVIENRLPELKRLVAEKLGEINDENK